MTFRPGKWTAAVLPLAMAIETALFAVLTAVLLDYFAHRPGPMSVTTLLPGLTYATATVMKVYILGSLLSVVIGWMWRFEETMPVWGLASIGVAPTAPLVGTLVVLIIQPPLLSMSGLRDFEQTARAGVFAMMAPLSIGSIAALVSLFRRERPAAIAILGLFLNALLIGLFCWFRFFALGFHQDNWAPG